MTLSKFIQPPSFPLLGKELMEQGNRKSTYIMRTTLILLVGIFVIISITNTYTHSQSGFQLSQLHVIGWQIFTAVMMSQLISVLIFLPGIMAPVITSEKENNSLELLFLTQMKPWEIIAQKYLGRIIPVLMFFFLGLPFLAIAYSFGGLDSDLLYVVPVIIICSILLIGAYSIMFSAFFATTISSVICSYIVTFLLSAILIQTINRLPYMIQNNKSSYDSYMGELIIGFTLFFTLAFLRCSVIFLKRRGLARRKSRYKSILEFLDNFWKKLNKKYAHGIILVKDAETPTPEMNPIEWQEKYKSSIGRASYRFRLGLIICIPMVLLLIFNWITDFNVLGNGSRLLALTYLSVLSIILVVKGTSAVSSERSGQRLDVLLTTAVTAKEIVKYKMKSSRTYIMLFSIPIAITSFFSYMPPLTNIIMLAIILLVYLPLISWFSCLIGLVVKNQSRAIIISLVAVIIWVLGSFVISPILDSYRPSYFSRDDYLIEQLERLILCLSPGYPIYNFFFENHYYYGYDNDRFIANFSFFYISTFILFCTFILLRWFCLRNADKYLRR